MTEKIAEIVEKAVQDGLTVPVERIDGAYWVRAKRSDRREPAMTIHATSSGGHKEARPARAPSARSSSSITPPAQTATAATEDQETAETEVIPSPSTEAIEPKAKQKPLEPSKDERDRHPLAELPFRSWRESCVVGRG